jgi:hypothetical protein
VVNRTFNGVAIPEYYLSLFYVEYRIHHPLPCPLSFLRP